MFITNKVPVKVFKEYVEYIDVFSKKTTVELLEYTRINDHPINIEESKQPLYGLIYNQPRTNRIRDVENLH